MVEEEGRKARTKAKEEPAMGGYIVRGEGGGISTRGLVCVDRVRDRFLAIVEDWLWVAKFPQRACCGGPRAVGWGGFDLQSGPLSCSFGQGRLWKDLGGLGLLLEVFFFFFNLFIYTCLCCEPNLYLKS